ncbi:MAG: twin-arginine translocase TatA/TatE family subunit [Candidatus Dormiibacterota bacterium]
MPFGFHPAYLLILLAIVLIIFGPSKLPQLGSAVGKTMKEFRKATDDVQDEIKTAVERQDADGEKSKVSNVAASSESNGSK